LAGLLIANHRGKNWNLGRRLVYILGSPLLPLVLGARVVPGTLRNMRAKGLPLSLLFWIPFGMVVKSVGELAGYLGAPPEASEKAMLEYEVHKLRYAGRAA
jgi:hypothetical protein